MTLLYPERKGRDPLAPQWVSQSCGVGGCLTLEGSPGATPRRVCPETSFLTPSLKSNTDLEQA